MSTEMKSEPDIGGADVLRHTLAAIKYRLDKTLDGAPVDFGDFSAGQGTRTPCELLRHIAAVVGGTAAKLSDRPFVEQEPGDLEAECTHTDAAIRALARCLQGWTLPADTARRLVQGPLVDAISHVGQLALLRRLAGSPIPGENFYVAAIDAADLEP